MHKGILKLDQAAVLNLKREEKTITVVYRDTMFFGRLQFISGLDKYDTERNVVFNQPSYVTFLSDCR